MLTETNEHLRDYIVAGGSHGNKRLKVTSETGIRSLQIGYLLAAQEYQVAYDDIANEANTAAFAIHTQRLEAVWSFYQASTVLNRKVISFTPATSDYYMLSFGHFQPTMTQYIDKVKVEPGAVSTAWEPMSSVEMGLATTKDYNTFFSGDAPEFQLLFWNDGVPTTKLVEYQIYDTRTNKKLIAATVNVVLPNGATTTTLPLPARNGSLRIMARLADADCWDELPVCVVPAAAESGVNLNGNFAGHTQAHVGQISFLRKMGIAQMFVRLGQHVTISATLKTGIRD